MKPAPVRVHKVSNATLVMNAIVGVMLVQGLVVAHMGVASSQRRCDVATARIAATLGLVAIGAASLPAHAAPRLRGGYPHQLGKDASQESEVRLVPVVEFLNS